MKKKVDKLPLDFMKSVARLKDGKIEIRKRPTETKIFLKYPDCRDCIHWKNCGKELKNLKIDTNQLAKKCREYRKNKTKNKTTKSLDWQNPHKKTKPKMTHTHR